MILARVRGGEREAYAELVRRHAPGAVRAAALLGAGADTEDVVQDAFVKAYRALGEFREGAEFRPWLLRIVANETRNAQRSARRRGAAWERAASASAASAGGGEPVDPAASALGAERRSELLAAIRELPEAHRLVVTCRYLLDLDEQQTATVLAWPRGTVKSRTHRALRRLRGLLETDGHEGIRAPMGTGARAASEEAGHGS